MARSTPLTPEQELDAAYALEALACVVGVEALAPALGEVIDRLRIDMQDGEGRSLFGAIEQHVRRC